MHSAAIREVSRFDLQTQLVWKGTQGLETDYEDINKRMRFCTNRRTVTG